MSSLHRVYYGQLSNILILTENQKKSKLVSNDRSQRTVEYTTEHSGLGTTFTILLNSSALECCSFFSTVVIDSVHCLVVDFTLGDPISLGKLALSTVEARPSNLSMNKSER